MNKRAGVARRLAATLYEALLLGALALVVEFAMLPALSPSPLPGAGERVLPLLKPGAQTISSGCLFVVFGAYCVWGWSGGRRTLPMKTWRIALESAAGARINAARAALRYVAWWIGPTLAVATYAALRPLGHGRWALALLAVNYAWALVDSNRQFLHDRLAGTRLAVAPRV